MTIKNIKKRFWSNVDIRENDECWPWLASKFPNGYGQFQSGRRRGWSASSHRITWEMTYGSIPDGLCVCHHCDNKVCCNPSHLFMGTQADNVKDMYRKGRDRQALGEQNGLSKLNKEQVITIRREYIKSSVTQRILAVRFNVSQANIFKIIHRESWKYI